ncbi:MAG: PSD1 and planctomycete cytochrome C domain-containing protein [Gemmataceae bacterium]
MYRLPLLLVVAAWPTSARAAEELPPDFYPSKVRPILATHCFKCHGPDEKTRKARLRLDVRDEALKPARSRKRAIVPGKPNQSELYLRVLTSDETEVMPPPSTKAVLTAQEKETLRRWIAAGAEYQPHWAFQSIRRPVVPTVGQADWPRNPLDRFLLARLEKERLRPSAEADRATLLRRVTFDLTGLPPSLAEIDAFLADSRPDAYERVVDRLLASPAYGERWARRWLDLARYADTNGYEKDRPRSIWPYRDWVIQALNADMPFDQFSIEQLAGDLLPGAGTHQRVATGFHRNTMLNEEGGIDPLEFRFHAMNDRVSTTGTVWLGLTLQCAQCHNHKYDPISQREYYQLFAFLNNADEPELEIVEPTTEARRKEVQGKIDQLEEDLARKLNPDQLKQFDRWLKGQREKGARWTTLRPTRARGSLPLLTIQDDHSVFVTGDQSKSDTYDLTFSGNFDGITALRLEVLPDERLPARGPGRVYYEGPFGEFFLSELAVDVDGKKVKIQSTSESFASGGNTAARAIDGDQQSGWSINGGQGRAHQAVFRFEKPVTARELKLHMLFERYYAAGLGRFRIAITRDKGPVSALVVPPALEELLHLPADKLTERQLQQLRRVFLGSAPEMASVRAPVDALRQQLPRPLTSLVFQERPSENPRPTTVHHRGEFLQPTEAVGPGTLSALHLLPADTPKNRLTFARWLVSRDNPLTARVTVNRHWAAFFGTGIVKTIQDFGLQGDLPFHPDLLDWLSSEFMDSGWSVKHLHRLITTSAAYRQSSRVSPELLAQDPDNRLLSRGPRVRLEAEMVRDLVLQSSGLLAWKLGGPSVYPPQPSEVTTDGAYGRLDWKPSEGLDRHRRGLYTFMKRTTPFAFFSTFDGPSGETCLARREVSNSPLQALTMLNDLTILEGAQALATQTLNQPGDAETRLAMLFRRILGRLPTAEESRELLGFHKVQLERFRKKELDPAALAGPGAGDSAERAAWVALTRVLFNLDETITKR